MAPRNSLAIILSTCALTACGAEAPAAFDAERAVAAWVDVWNSRDLLVVDSLFLNDPSATYFSSEKRGLIRGYAAVREHHEGFGFVPGGDDPAEELWIGDMEVSRHGGTAVVAAIWYFGNRSGDPESVQKGPMTAVYVLDAGEYRIAHMHFGTYLDE